MANINPESITNSPVQGEAAAQETMEEAKNIIDDLFFRLCGAAGVNAAQTLAPQDMHGFQLKEIAMAAPLEIKPKSAR